MFIEVITINTINEFSLPRSAYILLEILHKTSIAHWIKNSLRGTSELVDKYN